MKPALTFVRKNNMKIRNVLFISLLALSIVSCDDDIFGPRSLEGTWRVTEESEAFGRQTFIVGIGYFAGDSSRVLIGNFSNLDLGVEVVANVQGLSLTIDQQTVRGRGGSYRISGSGTATSNLRRINWTYRIDGANYTAVFDKN